MKVKPKVHLLAQVVRGTDPDARPEAHAECGEIHETSWSGKSGMVRRVVDATCQACIDIRRSRDRVTEDL